MKRITTIILVAILCSISALGLAENLTFNDVLESRGIVYTTKVLKNIVAEENASFNKFPTRFPNNPNMVSQELETDNSLLNLDLYRMTISDTEETIYAINLEFSNNKTFAHQEGFIEYSEINNIVKVLNLIKEYFGLYWNGEVSSDYNIYYVTLSGITIQNGLQFTTPTLCIIYDDDNYYIAKDVNDIDMLINYFENVDNMINYNKDIK